MRRSLLAVGAVALVGGPAALAFFSGGYFDRPRIIAGIAAWGLVVIAALVAPRPLPSSTPGRVALAGLFLLCAWTALSITWAPVAGRAQDDLQRLLLYLGVFIAALAMLRGAGARRWLEPALVLGALVVVGFGLSERLLPDLIELDRSRSAAGRLESPILYWNALGAVAAIGLVLAVRLAGDPDRERALRGGAAGAGVPLGLGVYLSFSRGALAAVAAGLLVLVALAPAGRSLLRSMLAILPAAALGALLATGLPTVKSLSRGEQGDAGDGLQMLAALVLLALLAAAIALRRPRRARKTPVLPISRPAAVLTAAAALVLAAALAAAVFEGKPETSSPVRGANPARLGSIDTNRYRYWEVALETWADHPLVGTGSGGFQVEWLKERDRVDRSGDAHSLYLETAAELGLVGLGFLLLFLGGATAGAVRLYRLDPAAAAGLAAGLAGWAVCAGLDWHWEMPAVTLLMLLLAAAAIAWSEERAIRTDQARPDIPAQAEDADRPTALRAAGGPKVGPRA
jgi:O-Antigen ligase